MNVKETHMIEGTPFLAIKTDEDKFMIALGNQIVSELEFDSVEEIETYCMDKPWDLLTSVTLILFNHLYTTKKIEEDDENERYDDYAIEKLEEEIKQMQEKFDKREQELREKYLEMV